MLINCFDNTIDLPVSFVMGEEPDPRGEDEEVLSKLGHLSHKQMILHNDLFSEMLGNFNKSLFWW